MSDCERIGSLLVAVAENDCDESVRAVVLKHTQTCGRCATELAAQCALVDALVHAPYDAPPTLYFEGVLASVHRRMSPARMQVADVYRRRGVTRAQRVYRYATRPVNVASAILYAMFVVVIGLPLLSGRGVGASYDASAERGVRVVAVVVGQEPVREERQLVLVQGIGLVSSDSELLRPENAAVLRDLGIYMRV